MVTPIIYLSPISITDDYSDNITMFTIVLATMLPSSMNSSCISSCTLLTDQFYVPLSPSFTLSYPQFHPLTLSFPPPYPQFHPVTPSMLSVCRFVVYVTMFSTVTQGCVFPAMRGCAGTSFTSHGKLPHTNSGITQY